MIALLSLPVFAADVEVEQVSADVLQQRLFVAPGKIRVVNFWATWCGPCVAEVPLLKRFVAAHPEVELLMVDLDHPKLKDSKVIPFLVEHGLGGATHLQLVDPDPVKAMPGVVPGWPDTLPVTLVVAADGRVLQRFHVALGETDLDLLGAAARVP